MRYAITSSRMLAGPAPFSRAAPDAARPLRARAGEGAGRELVFASRGIVKAQLIGVVRFYRPASLSTARHLSELLRSMHCRRASPWPRSFEAHFLKAPRGRATLPAALLDTP